MVGDFPKEFSPGDKKLCIELIRGVFTLISKYHLRGMEVLSFGPLQENNYGNHNFP